MVLPALGAGGVGRRLTLLTVTVLSPAAGLVLTAVVLGPYVAVLGMRRDRVEALPLPARWTRWLVAAVHEEEDELAEAVRPRRGTWRDAVAAAGALLAVVTASTVMEVAATAAGHRYGVADIVTGGLVLAVTAAARGRGTAGPRECGTRFGHHRAAAAWRRGRRGLPRRLPTPSCWWRAAGVSQGRGLMTAGARSRGPR